MRDLGSKISRLADKVLDDALKDDTSLAQRIDALKTVGTLHLGLQKLSDKVPSDADDADVVPFGKMRKAVREADGRK